MERGRSRAVAADRARAGARGRRLVRGAGIGPALDASLLRPAPALHTVCGGHVLGIVGLPFGSARDLRGAGGDRSATGGRGRRPCLRFEATTGFGRGSRFRGARCTGGTVGGLRPASLVRRRLGSATSILAPLAVQGAGGLGCARGAAIAVGVTAWPGTW